MDNLTASKSHEALEAAHSITMASFAMPFSSFILMHTRATLNFELKIVYCVGCKLASFPGSSPCARRQKIRGGGGGGGGGGRERGASYPGVVFKASILLAIITI